MKRTDLTLGPVAPGLLRFAFPLLLGTLVQQLYNTVDLIFVGHVIDSSASAAIGASTLLITCLIGFFGGMAVGAGVVIAQSFGERNPGKLDRAIDSTAALALAGGICLALLGWLLAPGYLRLIRTPDEIRAGAAVCDSAAHPQHQDGRCGLSRHLGTDRAVHVRILFICKRND